MTIEEAIKHCLETAEQLEERANIPYKVEDSELQDNACRECAADHRQLAEWLTELKELKAADVQPIRRGRWEEIEEYGGWGDTYFRCSICGDEWDLDAGTPAENGMKYCPNCGARMDKS